MILIGDKKYEVIENSRGALEEQALKEKLTDYFDDFDYIVGDWAYGKLRLKGFNEEGNPNFKKINDYAKVNNYIENFCAYGCKYFILKKIKS